MLSVKEKSVMKVIYYAAIERKDNVCLLRPIDILKGIPYKYEFSNEDLTAVIKDLALDDYFDFVPTEKKGETYYCFTLHQKGQAFYREILSEKRVIQRRILLSALLCIATISIKYIVDAIAKG